MNSSDRASRDAAPSSRPEAPSSAGKHTAGPWEADGPDVYASDGKLVAACADPLSSIEPEAAEANARLTASAPELRVALKGLLEFGRREWALDLEEEVAALVASADAAIAKAEGRQ